MIVNVRINNLPERKFEEPGFIVVRRDDSSGKVQLWYYGFYDDISRAEQAAVEIGNGIVLEFMG